MKTNAIRRFSTAVNAVVDGPEKLSFSQIDIDPYAGFVKLETVMDDIFDIANNPKVYSEVQETRSTDLLERERQLVIPKLGTFMLQSTIHSGYSTPNSTHAAFVDTGDRYLSSVIAEGTILTALFAVRHPEAYPAIPGNLASVYADAIETVVTLHAAANAALEQ